MQKSLILGLGKTGYSFAEYLSAKGESFDFADTRFEPADLNKFKSAYQSSSFFLGNLDENLLDDYDQLLLSPGVDVRHEFVSHARKKNIDIQSDIAIFISEVDAKIIGVTGSNGKTTLTSLLGHALSELHFNADIGGNIGVAALGLLNRVKKDIYVLELSSFQLDIKSDLPLHTAVVLNVSEDHLDRYDSYDDYAKSKASIYQCAETKLINLDDARCKAMVGDSDSSVISFSMHDSSATLFYKAESQDFYADGVCVCNAQQFLLKGEHNYQNILAALAVAKSIGVSLIAFAKAMSTFKGLPHRCEFVAEINDVQWINDSKATNIGATQAAIGGIKNPMHIIMGGQSKGVNFDELAKNLPEYVKSIVAIGEDAAIISKTFGQFVPVALAEDMQAAIGIAKRKSQAGEIVLLSPACASFDLYSGYEARGDHFKELVRECLV